jgi:hypothetical protein
MLRPLAFLRIYGAAYDHKVNCLIFHT